MNSFFRNNALIGLAEVLCRLPLIFTVGYLARSVGAEVFGNWALILTLQVFIVGVAGLGLSTSLSRYVPASHSGEAAAYLRYAFSLSLAPVLVIGVLTLLLKAPIGSLLGVKKELYWLLPMAVLLAAGSIADGFLDAFFKARMAIGRQIGFIGARTLIEIAAVVSVFVLAPPFLDNEPLQLAAYVGVVVTGKVVIYPVLFSGMGSGDRFPPPDRRGEFLKYGLPLVPTVLALWLVSQSDRLVLSHLVLKSELGVYAFGATLATYMVFLGYAVYPLLLPGASKLHDGGDTEGVHALFQDAQRLFVLLWAGSMTCLALWSAQIIAWTGGSAYAGAGQVFLILCFAVGVEQLMGIYQYVFYLVKRTDLILWLNVGYAALMMAALAIAGITSGIALAPWAVLSATVIFNVLRYRVALRYLPVPMAGTLVLKIAALAVLTALLARYTAEWNVALRLAIAAVVVLALAAYLLRRSTEQAGGLATEIDG